MQVMVKSVRTYAANLVRGGLIGTAEIIPGVSGGTVALVTGVYESLISSAGHVLSGGRMAVADVPRGAGFSRAASEFRRANWGVVLPVLIGLVCAALLAAQLLEPVLHQYPTQSRAMFFGLVLASLWVPISMVEWPWRLFDAGVAVVVAGLAFVLTSLPPTSVAQNPVVVALAASVAICALVLPGVSGSFFLLTLGLYEPTISALNDRDLGYIATFGLGAVIGLALFVKVLQWLLDHRRRMTLVVMTGVMAGCLRALWPWQDSGRGLLAPTEDVVSSTVFFVLGVVVVVGMLVVEHLAAKGRNADSAASTSRISQSG